MVQNHAPAEHVVRVTLGGKEWTRTVQITGGEFQLRAELQWAGKRVGCAKHLFSFGVVLYEMATGDLPFHGESSAMVCEAIMNRAPVAVARLNHGVPPKLENIINRA